MCVYTLGIQMTDTVVRATIPVQRGRHSAPGGDVEGALLQNASRHMLRVPFLFFAMTPAWKQEKRAQSAVGSQVTPTGQRESMKRCPNGARVSFVRGKMRRAGVAYRISSIKTGFA